MRPAMRSANCFVWLTRSGRPMAALRPGANPFQRDIRPALLGQGDLGVFDFHRQRMAALFVNHAYQPVEKFGLAGLLPDLADIGDHARLIHAVDARPGCEVVEIARWHVKPGPLHGAAEAEQRHHHAEAELAVEISTADAYAVIGENIGCSIGLAVALGPETHDRKVGRATADIGDQCHFLGRDLPLIVQGCGDRFELKRDVVKTDPSRNCPQGILRLAIGVRRIVDEVHRPAMDNVAQLETGGLFRAALHRAEIIGDDVAKARPVRARAGWFRRSARFRAPI